MTKNNILCPKFKKVKIKSVRKLDKKENVYDLVEPVHKLFITNKFLTFDTVNFGILYGEGANGLADSLGCSRSKAQEYIDNLFKGYKSLSKWVKSQHLWVKTNPYVDTLFGRTIPIEIRGGSDRFQIAEAERLSVNYPIQSTASDLVLTSLINLHRRFKEENLRSLIVSSVHDSVQIDIYPGELLRIVILIKEECEVKLMDKYDWLICPIRMDISIGTSWGGVIDFKVDHYSRDILKLSGSSLRRDFKILEEIGGKAYDIRTNIVEESPVKKGKFQVDQFVRDTEEWEAKVVILPSN